MSKIWRTFDKDWQIQRVHYNDEPPVVDGQFMAVDDGPNRFLFVGSNGMWIQYSDLEWLTSVKVWPNPFAEAYTYVSSRSGETKVSFTKAYPIAARDEWVDEKCQRLVNANVTIKGLLHEIYSELSGE